ncbi:MAG: glycine cleavage T C-terminal barrel domain-containing protein [Planctomycetota bacterium]
MAPTRPEPTEPQAVSQATSDAHAIAPIFGDLRRHMDQAGANWMPFGPPTIERDGAEPTQIEVAEDFGQFEAEYAAIRRNVGVMHLPWRRVIPLFGDDTRSFLHALLTQEINGMSGGDTRPALLLNAKGAIQADTVVHYGDAGSWLELDAFDALTVHQSLEASLFAEDVRLEPAWPKDVAMPAWTCFGLVGPACFALLDSLRDEAPNPQHPPTTQMGVHQVVTLRGAGMTEAVGVSIYRTDDAGVPGLRLWVPTEHAADVYAALLDAAGFLSQDPTEDPEAFAARRRESLRGRPVGWSAYNTARIEAGTPLFHVDFGPTNLPAEATLVDSHVSFTKGCYPGQEAVARMKNLGHPKKLLVALHVDGQGLPVAGTEVFDADDKGRVIGAITSSAASPLRGQSPIAIAMVRWGKHQAGTNVRVAADGQLVGATVTPLGDSD